MMKTCIFLRLEAGLTSWQGGRLQNAGCRIPEWCPSRPFRRRISPQLQLQTPLDHIPTWWLPPSERFPETPEAHCSACARLCHWSSCMLPFTSHCGVDMHARHQDEMLMHFAYCRFLKMVSNVIGKQSSAFTKQAITCNLDYL